MNTSQTLCLVAGALILAWLAFCCMGVVWGLRDREMSTDEAARGFAQIVAKGATALFVTAILVRLLG